jgi:hypothetical protein
MLSCAIPERREVEWRIPASEELRHSVETLFARQKTLEDVVRWGLAKKPPRLVADVVVQDEYTHDVIMEYAPAVFLVYDTT